GLSESAVLWRHAFNNAFGPTWTVIGLILGNLLGGIAVIETVFTIPGLGRLMVGTATILLPMKPLNVTFFIRRRPADR
ncbi:ABC transporter permease subunit, partial [Rhizobium ruizarguesonis]